MLPTDYQFLARDPVLSYYSLSMYPCPTDWDYGLHHSIRGQGDDNSYRNNARG